jgi:hypothetical protein
MTQTTNSSYKNVESRIQDQKLDIPKTETVSTPGPTM